MNNSNMTDSINYVIFEGTALCPPTWLTPQSKGLRIFNPSITSHKDGYIMCYRVVDNNLLRRIAICRLSSNFELISNSIIALSDLIEFTNHASRNDRAHTWHADPRLFRLKGKLYVSWNDGGNKPFNHQFLMELHEDSLTPASRAKEITIDCERRTIEKNWMFFESADRVWCIYSIEPFCVYSVDLDLKHTVHCKSAVTTQWESDYSNIFGVLRGSAQPLIFGDNLLTIAHSSYKMPEGRHYVTCAYEFSRNYPFEIKKCSTVPITLPNPYQKELVHQKLNSDISEVVYPCGSVLLDNSVVISYGVNDEACAVATFPLDKIIQDFEPTKKNTAIITPTRLTFNETHPAKLLDTGHPLTIPMFWWNAIGKKFDSDFGTRNFTIGNFGDIASRDIIQQLTNIQARPPSKNENQVLAIGSVLHRAQHNDIIWGTGVKGSAMNLSPEVKALNVYAVRGPHTLDFLKKHGIDTSRVTEFFDPGCLLAYLNSDIIDCIPQFKAKSIKIIPHYRDDLFMRRLYPQYRDNFISVDCSPLTMLQQMKGAEAVFSSSLHGLIFAESLGIPAYWLKPIGGEDELKFFDYYYGTNRTDVKCFTTLDAAIKSSPMALPHFKYEAYLKTFPYEAVKALATPPPQPVDTPPIRKSAPKPKPATAQKAPKGTTVIKAIKPPLAPKTVSPKTPAKTKPTILKSSQKTQHLATVFKFLNRHLKRKIKS